MSDPFASAFFSAPRALPSELEPMMRRRAFLTRSTTGLGAMALATLLNPASQAASTSPNPNPNPNPNPVAGALGILHHRPKAKRVSYLLQSGAPSRT